MSIILIILAFQFLIFIHELGHFLAAKRYGVAVEEFSLGIPPRIISKKIKETLYSLSLFPIGGYIKMKGFIQDENPNEKDNYAAKSIKERFVIIFAGPFFNLVLSFVLLWMVFLAGIQKPLLSYLPPILGKLNPESVAAQSGLRKGDEVIAVGKKSIKNWNELEQNIFLVSDNKILNLQVKRDESIQNFQIEKKIPLGLNPFLPPIIGQVTKNSPAQKANLREGDRILSINNESVEEWADISVYLQKNQNSKAILLLENQGKKREVAVQPVLDKETNRWILGVALPTTKVRLSFLQAMLASATEIVNNVTTTFWFLGNLIIGRSSSDAIGGPVMIVSVMQSSIERGLITFIYLTALISIQLAIFNLLPIPALDGGHLFFLIVEMIRGKQLSLKFRQRFQSLGFLFLLALIIFVTTKDIFRLVG